MFFVKKNVSTAMRSSHNLDLNIPGLPSIPHVGKRLASDVRKRAERQAQRIPKRRSQPEMHSFHVRAVERVHRNSLRYDESAKQQRRDNAIRAQYGGQSRGGGGDTKDSACHMSHFLPQISVFPQRRGTERYICPFFAAVGCVSQ